MCIGGNCNSVLSRFPKRAWRITAREEPKSKKKKEKWKKKRKEKKRKVSLTVYEFG
jgi:hypothetical protein